MSKYKLTAPTVLHDLDKHEIFAEKGDTFEIIGIKIYLTSDKKTVLISDKTTEIVKLNTVKKI